MTQRGIPRAKDPARYPLACRLVDLTHGCGSVLYGLTNGGRALYKCGRYMRTEGAECASNAVDGEAMLRFTLGTLRQLMDRLRQRLAQRARRADLGPDDAEVRAARLAELRDQAQVVGRRMATERDDARYEVIAREYDRFRREVREAEAALEALRNARPATGDGGIGAEVEAAMTVLDRLDRITSDGQARAEINPLMGTLGLRIGLTFGATIKDKKRLVRQLTSGVMAFDVNPLPVPMHGIDNAGCAHASPPSDLEAPGGSSPRS